MRSHKHPTLKSTRDAIVAEARSWVLTPFMHQQRLKGVGVDCVGVIVGTGESCQVLSINPLEWAAFAAYTRQPNPNRMLRGMRKFLVELETPREQIAPIGSIGWFGWREGIPMHLAIVAEYEGRPTMIHAYEPIKKCVENTIDSEWLGRLQSWWAYPGVANWSGN